MTAFRLGDGDVLALTQVAVAGLQERPKHPELHTLDGDTLWT